MGDVMSVEDRRYVTYLMIAKELIKIQPIDAVKINKIASKYDLSYGDINRIWKQLVDGKCTPKKMTFLDRCDFMMPISGYEDVTYEGDMVFKCPLYEVRVALIRLEQNKTPEDGQGFCASFMIYPLTKQDVNFFAELTDIKIGGINFGKCTMYGPFHRGNELIVHFALESSLFWNCPQVLDECFVEAKFVSQYSNTYRPITRKFVAQSFSDDGKCLFDVELFRKNGIINTRNNGTYTNVRVNVE